MKAIYHLMKGETISGKAFTIEEKTFYNKNGDYIARICILISILLLLISFSKVKD